VKRFLMRLARNCKAQDLTEYALMAGFVAVAAGAIMPNVSVYVSAVFSNVTSTLTNAAS
jgi:pilus assembly protein Flp/PilA